jgi:hypothetical protein
MRSIVCSRRQIAGAAQRNRQRDAGDDHGRREKLDADDLDANQDTIRQLAGKLHPDAAIDLACCDVGLGQSFIKRCARGVVFARGTQ